MSAWVGSVLRTLLMQIAYVAALCLAAIGPISAQEATVELPGESLRVIGADYRNGRNVVYCFRGRSNFAPQPTVRVDSVWVVAALAECPGIGVGFISRIGDRDFMVNALRGIIDGNRAFQVVTVFYSSEVDSIGHVLPAIRTLSIVRGGAEAVRTAGL